MTRHCTHCGAPIITSDESDARARAEALEVFGRDPFAPNSDMVILCDDCYRDVTAWLDEQMAKAGGTLQ